MKELIPGYIGEEDVCPPVVIVVPDGDAHAISLAFHTSALCNIGEGSVAVIVVQTVPILRRLFLQRWDSGPIDKVNVQIPVIVIVEKRYPGKHGLGQILVRRRGVVGHEVDACALRYLLKNNGA